METGTRGTDGREIKTEGVKERTSVVVTKLLLHVMEILSRMKCPVREGPLSSGVSIFFTKLFWLLDGPLMGCR